MKRFFSFLFFLVACTSLTAATISERCAKDSIRYKGATRVFWVYTPSHLAAEAPLLVCLHGYGGKAEHQPSQLVDLAEEKGFVVTWESEVQTDEATGIQYTFRKYERCLK